MSFIELTVYSDALQMHMNVNVMLPTKKPDDKYKVLWLIHGGHGDHGEYVRNTNVMRMAEEKGFAIVMPGVHNSCYVDMLHGGRYGTYMGEELPAKIRSIFPILSEDREDNWISGFSNGGYGSLRTALYYPEVFGYVGAFAAGDQPDNPFVNDGSKNARNRIALFGDGKLDETEYSVKYCARQLLGSGRPLPKICHACGEFDPWHDKNQLVRRFFESLEGNPFQYRYKEYPGLGHSYVCEEAALKDFIDYLYQ